MIMHLPMRFKVFSTLHPAQSTTFSSGESGLEFIGFSRKTFNALYSGSQPSWGRDMFYRIEDFAKAWEFESAATQKLMDELTDGSLRQAVTGGHRDLGLAGQPGRQLRGGHRGSIAEEPVRRQDRQLRVLHGHERHQQR
jgi:hypothetical protein